ncbi:hypothetical protein GCM10011374_29360 [Kocuria dechangensis]|uniref:Glycosyl hydrolase family 79 n=1 Tax=Kocuria dechangensis TaxID=1176249 RepID=A0A917H0Z8_9MICC|nr:hypothetical protein [Kocuria dechangensis]GGG63977.1 hypothetical protein GCM10011374_29360 [Kocuria dechangensis]
MHRPARRAVPALAVSLALALSGCGDGTTMPDPAATTPATAGDTPLTEIDPAEIAEQRDLPETYRQPAVDGTAQPAATVAVDAEPTGEDYAHGGVGLSFEATELADERLSAENTDLVHLVRQMDQPTLRFGGNSVDRRFFFTAEDEQPPTDWPLQKGEQITTVTPEDLERVAGFAEATGSKVILGANLAADDPRRAAELAEHGRAAFGDDLIALMVGNEPNGFYKGEDHRLTVKDENWDIPQYLADLEQYTAAVRAAVPDLTITGPGAYAPDWWAAVAESGIEDVVLAAHQYPLSSCDGSTPHQEPTMRNLVAEHTRDNVDRFLGLAVDQGKEAGLPVWLSETSVSACTGSNDVTESLGSAVFSAEYSLRAQSLGVERLVYHSSLDQCAGGPPMSPVCSSGTREDPSGAYSLRANHLGMTLVGQIPDGDFLGTAVAGNEDVTAYTIDHGEDPQGRRQVTLALTTFADPAGDGRTPVTVDLPFAYAEAVMAQLGGPDWDAQFPKASLFDVAPEDGERRTEDTDGRAQTVDAALTPIGDDHVSVDGWGLPLTPVSERPKVPGAEPSTDELRLSLNPGTVTVVTLTQE